MITNEREYRITKARIADPEAQIARVRERTDIPPEAQRLFVDALLSSIESMRAEVEAYERLRAGHVPVRVTSLAGLPAALVEARIVRGWTQRELAERLGVAEQAVQRHEATQYRGMAIERVIRVADVLGFEIGGELADAPPTGAATPARTRTPRGRRAVVAPRSTRS